MKRAPIHTDRPRVFSGRWLERTVATRADAALNRAALFAVYRLLLWTPRIEANVEALSAVKHERH